MKTALMSTYFNGRMPNYLRWYLEELRTYFDRVVLLTYNTIVPSDNIFCESIGGIVQHVLSENSGFDFGAWNRTIHYLDNCTHGCLVNDSCIPFRPLKPFFEWFDKNRCDYAGFTNNLEFHYHIQSYFVIMRGEKTISFVKDFFKEKGIITNKFKVIQEYEIGLSNALASHGFKIGAMYDCKIGKVNWTMKRAIELINMGYPFVKRRLGIKKYANILKEIAAMSCDNVNIEYILEGLTNESSKPDAGKLSCGIR